MLKRQIDGRARFGLLRIASTCIPGKRDQGFAPEPNCVSVHTSPNLTQSPKSPRGKMTYLNLAETSVS